MSDDATSSCVAGAYSIPQSEVPSDAAQPHDMRSCTVQAYGRHSREAMDLGPAGPGLHEMAQPVSVSPCTSHCVIRLVHRAEGSPSHESEHSNRQGHACLGHALLKRMRSHIRQHAGVRRPSLVRSSGCLDRHGSAYADQPSPYLLG